MDALSISVISLIVLVIISFVFLPVLRHKLSVRDGMKFYFDGRYQLFVFAHSRFDKVREGKQVYERYRDFVKALYNKDNFDKAKSEHENNQRRINLSFLSEVVEDEQFVRRFFYGESLPYGKFLEMEEEWEMRPVKAVDGDSTDVSADIQSEEGTTVKSKTRRNQLDAVLKDILSEKAPDNTEDYAAKFVRIKQQADDLIHLYYALQQAQYVNCDWKTFYHTIKNSYPEYITREERTFRGAKAKRDNTDSSYEMNQNHLIEQRIIEQIQSNLNP